MTITRREFLKGCAATAALGATGPALLFSNDAHAAANPYDTVVHLFLRGGIDGLNLVVPISGNDRTFYEQARPNLSIPATGTYGALPLTLASNAATGFGLHPSATGLRDLWSAGHMAIVHACGLATSVTRSHFDAQMYIDLGTPGQQGIGSGWLARAMNSQPGVTGSELMPALNVGARQSTSMLSAVQALTMSHPSDFQLNAGAWSWQTVRADSPAGYKGLNETLIDLWGGDTALELGGQRADRSLKVIARQTYSSPPTGWPDNDFARQLWVVAQSIQFNLGLRYASLDLGGWDTHDGQGTAGTGYHYYQNKIAELSAGIAAFFGALSTSGHMSRVTLVVQSEFGRRVRANGNNGTDHGYGNPLFVLGGAVNGRKFYGNWSGLDPEILSPHFGDVPVTTDHRRVLSEILIRRMANPNLSAIFPGYSGYSPMGIMKGTDIAPKAAFVPPMPVQRAAPATRSQPAAQPESDLLDDLMRFVSKFAERI